MSAKAELAKMKPVELPSLRDQFAMAALTGLLIRRSEPSLDAGLIAYEYADAMLEARKQ